MTLYFCLDEKNGMLFNRRRQSRDEAVMADIQSRLGAGELLIDPISQKLAAKAEIPYCFALPELTENLPGAHFFVEERVPGDWVGLASCVVVYRWNRHYPADQFFDIDLTALGFSLSETMDFPGKSHETITREVYVK